MPSPSLPALPCGASRRVLRGIMALVLLASALASSARANGNQQTLVLENAAIELRISTADGSMAVLDKRTNRTWTQRVAETAEVQLIRADSTQVALQMRRPSDGAEWRAEFTLDSGQPEVLVAMTGHGPLAEPVAFPHPFVTGPGSRLIVPLNEGISFPVDDPAVPLLRLPAYSGHGLSMPFFGVTEGDAAHLVLIETPDDVSVRMKRRNASATLCLASEWEPQLHAWGEPRVLRYVFFDRGGFVAMCKYYRRYAQQTGLFKTLAEKRRTRPDIDRLVGAANIWCWEPDPLPLVDEMLASGMTRLLWSNSETAAIVDPLNARGLLTSCYDNYKNSMNPAEFPQLWRVSSNWVAEAWPADLARDDRGATIPAWSVEGRDGRSHACDTVCDLRAPAHARRRIASDLGRRQLRARFLDTVAATPFVECHDPAHPMNRTASRQARAALLSYVSDELHLVLGTENGMAFAVPHADFFEGMMSLDNFRVPQSGRKIREIWSTVPDAVARFQVGHRYRLPLWELVFHECAVSYWYWGDYNNKLTPIWPQRDLFNVLYGTPPMFVLTREMWQQNQARFVKSYRDIVPVARAAGDSEMTDFRLLTEDRDVQQSTFANGLVVVVNFGDRAYRPAHGPEIPPAGFAVHFPAIASAPPP